MRTSQYIISTLKETPNDAEIVSHQLMIRAGLIRKLGAGLYTWMPLGLRVMRKVEAIVREEMASIFAHEILMPAVQPSSLWEETGRWEQFGPQLLKMVDRHERQFCFGPTHEEVITDLARKELNSYKQLPLTMYQIQIKFRDEIRPRFGVMRAREFMMKDAYSFHLTKDCLVKTYDDMYKAYSRIFNRLGLTFRAVMADTGAIGGSGSHEFHVLADSGEDKIMYCPDSDYAANVELAPAILKQSTRAKPNQDLKKVHTPGIKTATAVCEALNVPAERLLKVLLVKGAKDPVVAILIRGDHTLHELKAAKCDLLAQPLTLIDEVAYTKENTSNNFTFGYLGPKELNIPVIRDHAVDMLSDFVCGANEVDYHYTGMNWDRDCPLPGQAFDLREAEVGDLSPDGKGELQACRGIEVGHIFQLGNKYSTAMNATVLDENGKAAIMEMGCYGLGISRVVAAAIEQNFDENGIVWPKAMSPFQVAIVPMNLHKSELVQAATESLYNTLTNAGIEVLLDDRKERPGVMFADLELIGIPHRIVIGERGLAGGTLEYKGRRDEKAQEIPKDECLSFIQKRLAE